MHKNLTEKTTIVATRYDGFCVDEQAVVGFIHEKGLNLLDAIDKCFTAWYKTEQGRKDWEDSFHDYNIGDWLSNGRPDARFTREFGFVIVKETNEVIDISYDRILGDEPEYEDEDED